jgi:hypothetical protein
MHEMPKTSRALAGGGRGYDPGVPVFICPGCGRRTTADRHQGHQPRGCVSCGFGFLFELLDDYYPSPKTALVVCDNDKKVLAAGHATTAVTGFQEQDLLGYDLMDRLVLDFGGDAPADRSLEWGVRVMGVDCTFRPKGVPGDRSATADFFPAYDDDGGLLVAITPK